MDIRSINNYLFSSKNEVIIRIQNTLSIILSSCNKIVLRIAI